MEPYQLKCHNHKCDKQPNSDITSYSASYYRCKSNHHVFCSEKCKLEFDLIKCNRCGYNEQWNKQFKGKYSKLAQVSRNSLVFVEYFQNAINEEIEKVKNNKTTHSIEDMNRLITCSQKIQRLAEQANTTLTNLENPLMSLTD